MKSPAGTPGSHLVATVMKSPAGTLLIFKLHEIQLDSSVLSRPPLWPVPIPSIDIESFRAPHLNSQSRVPSCWTAGSTSSGRCFSRMDAAERQKILDAALDELDESDSDEEADRPKCNLDETVTPCSLSGVRPKSWRALLVGLLGWYQEQGQ
ncbi:hypothetical protein THAOC_24564, partial [Thalassiosira oceanica]